MAGVLSRSHVVEGVQEEVGWKSNTRDFALGKNRRSVAVLLEDSINLGFDPGDLGAGRIGKTMFGRAEFLRHRGAHANGKATKKSIVVEEWALLETMGFGLADDANRSFRGVMRAKVMNELIMVVIKVMRRAGSESVDLTVVVGVAGLVASGSVHMFERTIGVGEIVSQCNGESAGVEEMLLVGVLAIKPRHLGEVFGMRARLNKTINHVGRCHVVGALHEDGTETDGVNEVVVEFEDILGVVLAWEVHSQDNGLVDIPRMGVANKGKKDFETIVSGCHAFGCLRTGWEDTRALQNVAKITLPMEEFGDFGLGQVGAKVKTGGATMRLREEFIRYNVVTTQESVISKVTVPSA